MALIDIDRHILAEIAYKQKEIEKETVILGKHWRRINSLWSEQKALMSHIVNRVQEADTGKGKES